MHVPRMGAVQEKPLQLLAEDPFHHPLNTLRNRPVVSTADTAANEKYLRLKPSMKQIPWHGSELLAPDGPPGLLVNPVLRLCHKEA